MTKAQAEAGGKGLVRFRMDDAIKEMAEETLELMGLTFASVVTVLARRIAAEGKLPFEIYAVDVPNEATRRAMMESRAIINSGEARFGSVEEMIGELEKESGKPQRGKRQEREFEHA